MGRKEGTKKEKDKKTHKFLIPRNTNPQKRHKPLNRNLVGAVRGSGRLSELCSKIEIFMPGNTGPARDSEDSEKDSSTSLSEGSACM